MSDNSGDRDLGMERKITRRDFLDGMALTIGGSVLASAVPQAFARGLTGPSSAPDKASAYYPQP